MNKNTTSKTMLRNVAMNINRRIDEPESDLKTLIESARQGIELASDQYAQERSLTLDEAQMVISAQHRAAEQHEEVDSVAQPSAGADAKGEE